MNFNRLIAGRHAFVVLARVFVGAVVCGIFASALVLAGSPAVAADGEFPFDQELLLDTAPMRPVKRVPMVTVDPDGRATINLWCRSVPALVQLSGSEIRIQAAPLPESLPLYMSEGQCSQQRVQADIDMLAALAQVTQWQRRIDGVVLSGPNDPKPMRFRVSSH